MAKGSYIHKIMTWCIFPIVVEWVKFNHTRLVNKNPIKVEKPQIHYSQKFNPKSIFSNWKILNPNNHYFAKQQKSFWELCIKLVLLLVGWNNFNGKSTKSIAQKIRIWVVLLSMVHQFCSLQKSKLLSDHHPWLLIG